VSATEPPLTATISADTREKLDRFAEESGVERDEVVERALRWYIRGATADRQRDLEAAALPVPSPGARSKPESAQES